MTFRGGIGAACEEARRAAARNRPDTVAAEERRQALREMDGALLLLEESLAGGRDSAAVRDRAVHIAERAMRRPAPQAVSRSRSSAELHDALLTWQWDVVREAWPVAAPPAPAGRRVAPKGNAGWCSPAPV